MSQVLVHVSINIRKSLQDMLREKLKEFNRIQGRNVTLVTASNDESENWLVQGLEQGSIPQLAIAHSTDFVPVNDEDIKKTFCSRPGKYPLRTELAARGLRDPAGIIHPIALIPFVMAANAKALGPQEMPVNWEDLLSPKWHHKVVFPEAITPISLVVSAVLNSRHPEKFKGFYPTIFFDHSPVEAIRAVATGSYPLGIANLGFSKATPRNIVSILPGDGAICTALVLVCSREAEPSLLEFARVLFDKEIQEMFAQQGFIPVSPDVDMPRDKEGRAVQFSWDGWPRYFDLLRGWKAP